ncbi:MAG: 30S ribosomal protein S11 [Elusimicrobia bacterium RIFCSPLOWO2_12_FULL_59_9]|nr:MAG: 30S ribosomal protein S11 [Elusimicrobia bacterium RIFCSPLOWO2_12_FULL_59_9]
MEEEAKPEKDAKSEAESAAAAELAKKRKKTWRGTVFAKIYIQSTFNNTIVTVTNEKGNVMTWGSAGWAGFKGTKKGTPFAAQVTADRVARKALELGVRQAAVLVRGPCPGRETAIRALQATGLQIVSLKDVTPLPHNGCRPRKARRV